ncbi:MAG: universal stress protein [Burkholderiales bacterium]
MSRVLVPVTDPERAARAVEALVREADRARDEVLLVGIVEPMTPGRIPLYLSPSRAAAMATEAAERWLAPLTATLATAGIRHRAWVHLGRPHAVIDQIARDQRVDRVVFPASRSEFWKRWSGDRLARERRLQVTFVA